MRPETEETWSFERRVALRRAREEKERRRAARRARLRRLAVLSVALFAIGLLGTATGLWLMRATKERVTGRLAGVRDVSFVAGTQDGGGISPVCGCLFPPVDSWRGITFAGRRISLRREGRAPWTQWAISGAEADQVSLYGGFKRLKIEAVRLKGASVFDPRAMLDGRFAPSEEVIKRATVRGYLLSLLTKGTLHLNLLGPVPVGSWIPFPGAKVSLTASRSPFPGERQAPQIVERYPADIGVAMGEKPNEPQIYPVGDFLGPDLVLWTDEPGARVPGTPFGRPAGLGVVTALLIRGSTFSTRIGAMPLTERARRLRHQEDSIDPEDASSALFYDRYDGGRVTLTVLDPLDDDSYQAMRARVDADPVTAVGTVQPMGKVNAEGLGKPVPVTEAQRYPPLPRYAGFNLFGPLDDVFFRGVHGHVSVADRPLDLSGSADLELGDVRGLRNVNRQQLLAAPLATSRESANLQFRAVGSVAVNGVLQTTVWRRHATELAVISAVVTLLSGLLAIAVSVRRLRGAP